MGALCKFTLTLLKVWVLRNLSERENVESFKVTSEYISLGSHTQVEAVRWSLCCGVKPNHLLCTLLYVYICLHVGSGLDMKQEELQDLETLKNIKS